MNLNHNYELERNIQKLRNNLTSLIMQIRVQNKDYADRVKLSEILNNILESYKND